VFTAKAVAQALALCPLWQLCMDAQVVVAHVRRPHPVVVALFGASSQWPTSPRHHPSSRTVLNHDPHTYVYSSAFNSQQPSLRPNSKCMFHISYILSLHTLNASLFVRLAHPIARHTQLDTLQRINGPFARLSLRETASMTTPTIEVTDLHVA